MWWKKKFLLIEKSLNLVAIKDFITCLCEHSLGMDGWLEKLILTTFPTQRIFILSYRLTIVGELQLAAIKKDYDMSHCKVIQEMSIAESSIRSFLWYHTLARSMIHPQRSFLLKNSHRIFLFVYFKTLLSKSIKIQKT